MNHRTNALVVVAAVLVAAAASVGGIALAAGASASPTDAVADTPAPTGTVDGVALQTPLADLTGTLERLDAFLETVLDLVRTVSQLFGAGAGEAGD